MRERLGRVAGERSPLAGSIEVASGDDAAVTVPRGATVTSVDLAIEDVHFRRSTFPPQAIGHKALAAALSDLAAMGATPGEAYVQLGIPDDVGDEEILALADGMGEMAGRHGVKVLGGDLSRADGLTLAVTVVGHSESAAKLVLRSGAREGDVVAVTGALGGAAAGLLLLERPELGDDLDQQTVEALRQRQLAPEPEIAAGQVLAAAGATAMIDISDGLGADSRHLATASGIRLELDMEELPIAEGVPEVATAAGRDPIEFAAGGGEDYELLVTLPQTGLEHAARELKAAGITLSAIGRVAAGIGVALRRRNGDELEPAGFDQLRGRRRPRPRSDRDARA